MYVIQPSSEYWAGWFLEGEFATFAEAKAEINNHYMYYRIRHWRIVHNGNVVVTKS